MKPTSYFWTRDAQSDLHCPGLLLIPSANKLDDISSQRAIRPLRTWNLLFSSPRILIIFLTSSGFHLFLFSALEDFCRDFGRSGSTLILSSLSFSWISRSKLLLPSDCDEDINDFQKSSDSLVFGAVSGDMEVDVIASSLWTLSSESWSGLRSERGGG